MVEFISNKQKEIEQKAFNEGLEAYEVVDKYKGKEFPEEGQNKKLSIFGSLTIILVGSIAFQLGRMCPYGSSKLAPTNAHIEYVNQDSLSDLVYKTGEIYLQKEDGSFVLCESVMKQEKAKIDSVYQVKQDSLKKIR